jgi:hypothetical protein
MRVYGPPDQPGESREGRLLPNPKIGGATVTDHDRE